MTALPRRAAALIAISAVLVGATGCRDMALLSTRDEVKIGEEAAAEVARRYPVQQGTPDARRVEAIGRVVLLHSERRDGVPYSFRVLDLNEINALALPGGPVYVYRGLLDLVGNDDAALACVVAHEVGHLDARHGAKQLSRQIAASLSMLLLLRSRAVQDVGALTTDLMNLSYSRSDEYEADQRAMSYAHKAGQSATGLLTFFRKLEAAGRQGDGGVQLLRTHPYLRDRIKRAERTIERQDYPYGR